MIDKEIIRQMQEEDAHRKTRKRTHPSEILMSEFIDTGAVNVYEIIFDMKIDPLWFDKFCKGRTAMTEDFAEKLSARLGTTKEFWTNLQDNYDN